ncbi:MULTISPECIES: 30S ribosomal protein S9 [Desulfococcus]|jgi:small subunit ribosomal protein S9|uniref:Small ribosomal subunit protein uS9 n=1 Tax=Desulfococcus multivorans DSM 2059 TaxID=1121405 RepID=S7TSJ3_DESML|nr:30S ribosomal protein S9 [Desulfococcus multivorans]AOY59493.1 RpsI: 30S ribosomal protein S9 [Desulfococcus multivorans]AQV01693.1 30S ribosomal protein S9 [Desulfococcus multivorans]EPR39996.1 Ribosomal protein S9, bacterial/plastid [Desulfococcus multivorans DSM 2059]MDX9817419.1 30S ribosomal protein S9 [Desulfococcus multivorans]SKA01714.1 SSU ribosomal protein S9P [Desulfococcus multivorans DSM 2059]
MEKETVFYATGRRKTAVARTWIKPGRGKILINNREIGDYIPTESMRLTLIQPLNITNNIDSFDINVTVSGGGISGQVGAIRHGLTRALIEMDPDLRPILKKAGFVKRDPRVKERKKYGQKGARARFQFSKR